jgi:hypothetical protein
MNSQLFLIIVVIIVLVIIHRTSNDMPVVQESANSVPVSVPVRLPQLENIFKNVLSNSMPVVQEPFYDYGIIEDLHNELEKINSNDISSTTQKTKLEMLHKELEKLNSNDNSIIQQWTLRMLNQYALLQLKFLVNYYAKDIDGKYDTLVYNINNAYLD